MVWASRRRDSKSGIVASKCVIGIDSSMGRSLRQLQVADIHHIMDSRQRWKVQVEGIRAHLLYDGLRTC
jgi:hypothetical protein